MKYIPLADVLRPNTLDEIIGQQHLVGKDAPFRKLIESDKLQSFILYGPPGTGKTTIGAVVAKITKRNFVPINATNASIKDIRKVADRAEKLNDSVIIFVDECHRFNRTQQDSLLPYVEKGNLIFIGATTENPFHSVNEPLISRSQIFKLEPLGNADIAKIIKKVIDYYKNSNKEIKISKEAAMHLIKVCCGDGRKAITILDTLINMISDITLEAVQLVAPNKYMSLTDDDHFDLASWTQGALQASDPDAAVFALAKWLESGEDPRYIARRIMTAASEDAAGSPEAAIVAHSAYVAACEIGRPECDIILAHAAILIASCPRDKSAAKAIWTALKDVRDGFNVEVPKQMRDSHYSGAAQLNQGSYKDGKEQSAYIGVNKTYYKPPISSKYKNKNLENSNDKQNEGAI